MKSNFKKTLLFSLSIGLFSISSYALAEGNFIGSCNNLRLENPSLSANCKSVSGGWNGTSINLNGYITNNNGRLAWQRNGGFAKTVKGCYLWGTTLNCQARSAGGQWLHSELNLNERLGNSNGNLVYDGP